MEGEGGGALRLRGDKLKLDTSLATTPLAAPADSNTASAVGAREKHVVNREDVWLVPGANHGMWLAMPAAAMRFYTKIRDIHVAATTLP